MKKVIILSIVFLACAFTASAQKLPWLTWSIS